MDETNVDGDEITGFEGSGGRNAVDDGIVGVDTGGVVITADGFKRGVIAVIGDESIGQGVNFERGDTSFDGDKEFSLDRPQMDAAFEHESLFLGVH